MEQGPLRVLVVDDNIEFALGFAAWLQALGCRVELAFDAHSALLKAVPERPHLVFMDLHLGTEDGSQVMTALRRMLHDDEGLTIVCLTGRATPETELQCRKAGFDLFFTKPVAATVLHDLLSACQARVEAARRAEPPPERPPWMAGGFGRAVR